MADYPEAGPGARADDRSGRKVLGCLACGCLGLVLVSVLGFGGLVYGGLELIKSSDVYTMAVQDATTDPRVKQALGSDVRPGWWVVGTVNINNGSGDASMTIPLEGNAGSGHLVVEATRANSVWQIDEMVLETEGREIWLVGVELEAIPETVPDEDVQTEPDEDAVAPAGADATDEPAPAE